MKEYLKKALAVNADDPDEIVKAIQKFLDDDSLSSEQKLFAFGLIVNKNKEYYILELKRQLSALKIDFNKYKMQHKEKSKPKKKIVVVKKKQF